MDREKIERQVNIIRKVVRVFHIVFIVMVGIIIIPISFVILLWDGMELVIKFPVVLVLGTILFLFVKYSTKDLGKMYNELKFENLIKVEGKITKKKIAHEKYYLRILTTKYEVEEEFYKEIKEGDFVTMMITKSNKFIAGEKNDKQSYV
jgi:hypothetical protein